MLYVVHGVPCSGKSYFIHNNVDFVNCFYLQKDWLKDIFLYNHDRSSPQYQYYIKPRMRIAINTIIHRNIDNVDMVIEDTFWDKLTDEDWATREFDLPKKFIKEYRCVTTEEVLKQRMIDRNLLRDRNKLKDNTSWKDFLDREPIRLDWYQGTVIYTGE